MNENDGAITEGFDPDTAPDLSRDGWPEKFATQGVSAMGRWSHRFQPKYWPKWYRIAFGASIAGALLGGALAWFGSGRGRYTALVGVLLCVACLWLLQDLLEKGPKA
ncbi:hypothetical protein [Candidatus Palauibacter sp.]|uniref:hypothetical protein n=1 Tax=Candidatus Palauibacter sp. TaxID=3101350 RepID=UPI003D0DD930